MMHPLLVTLGLCLVLSTTAFNRVIRHAAGVSKASTSTSFSPSFRQSTQLFAGPELDPRTEAKINDVITKNKVVLFMKGNKIFPQCGFSNTACRILDALETPYETVDVLSDQDIRAGIKVFSAWPTIPQLYINGEFVGGSDIMIEMYNNGELAETIELANAS